MAVRGVVMWIGLRKEELEQRREVEALVVWGLWRRIGRRTAAEEVEEGGDWGLMVVVIEEIRAATAAMGSGNGEFQKEKIGEDSIGDGVVGRRKGTFLIHLRYADIRKLKINFFFLNAHNNNIFSFIS